MIGNNKMIVNDFDTENIFIIRRVNRGLTGSYSNKTEMMRLLHRTRSERTIEVEVTLISKEGLDQLKAILDSYETVQFVFEDEKDWYWNGVLSANKLDSSYVGADITLEILVPDGVKHAVNPKGPFTATLDAEGRYFIEVDNTGTVDAPITMTATMNAENGYIGMYTDYAITEIGNKEEDDTENYISATTLVNTDDPLSKFTRYTGVNPENSAVSNSGTATTRVVNARKHMYLSDTGTNNGAWHGASYVYNFPPDGVGDIGSINAYAYFNAPFWAGKMGQVGQIQVHFATAENEFICGFHLAKGDTKGNTGSYFMRYRDSATTIKTFKTQQFKTSHLNNENPHNLPRGHSDMRKRGAEITFYWFGGYPKVTVPYLANKKVAKVYLNLYTLANYPKMSYFDFRNIVISNDGATYNRDIKNRYQVGTTVKMTGADSKVYINDMPKLSEKVLGSNLFTVPPGKTKIYFQCSTWCTTPPTYQIEFTEASL
ncbi:distal tail protein Dit [Lactococcus chungangensis]|uniref:distal tail protein Dit n=1 Tax=Pseudolactococcus chungangensis TaxID=451457 RepID=UPI003734DE17